MNQKFESGTIRQSLHRLREEGFCITEGALRTWVKNGQIPASYCGKRAYIYYPNVIEFLKKGTQPQEKTADGIRRIG